MRPLRWCWPPPAAAARVGASRRASTARRGALSSTGDDTVDVCIVGGGAVGSSIAYHAATLLPPGTRIAVIEQDPSYTHASTPLSAGGIRQQFSLRENIQMSMYGAEFVKAAPQLLAVDGEDPPNLQFKERGYLFLASAKGEATLRANHREQRAAGVDWVDLLTPVQLEAAFPWLAVGGGERGEEEERQQGVVLGSLGRGNEGYLDPWLLLQALKRKAESLGVDYIRARAGNMRMAGRQVLSIDITEQRGEGRRLTVGTLVNAAGAFAHRLLPPTLFPLPVRARRRLVFPFHCPSPHAPPAAQCPLVIDPSGAYFRSEGRDGHFICGVSPTAEEEDPDHESSEALAVGERDYALFNDRIWPALYRRVPAFAALKATGAWAGYYAVNVFDHNALLGPHPQTDNLLLAVGFSGHGLQQAPAVGRGLAELVSTGGRAYQTLNLSRLELRRVMEGAPLREANIV